MKLAAMASVVLLGSAPHQALTVSAGETFMVEMEDISTTGYTWRVNGFDTTVVASKGDSVKPGAAPGASGLRTFLFQAVAPGQTKLSFELRRSWEKDAKPARQSDVQVTVK
jgi:predicted secreted protein